MPHGFTLKEDSQNRIRWAKTHDNGERTVVDLDKKVPGTDHRVRVRDPRGNTEIGRFKNLSDAKRAAKQWMQNNPKGVRGQGQDIAGMGGGIPGVNGDTIF